MAPQSSLLVAAAMNATVEEWRAALRDLQDLDPASPEAQILQSEVRWLRAAYLDAMTSLADDPGSAGQLRVGSTEF